VGNNSIYCPKCKEESTLKRLQESCKICGYLVKNGKGFYKCYTSKGPAKIRDAKLGKPKYTMGYKRCPVCGSQVKS